MTISKLENVIDMNVNNLFNRIFVEVKAIELNEDYKFSQLYTYPDFHFLPEELIMEALKAHEFNEKIHANL